MTKEHTTPDNRPVHEISLFGPFKNAVHNLYKNGYEHAGPMLLNSVVMPALGAAAMIAPFAPLGLEPQGIINLGLVGGMVGSVLGQKFNAAMKNNFETGSEKSGGLLHWGLTAGLTAGAFVAANAAFLPNSGPYTVPVEQMPLMLGAMAAATTPVFIQAAGMIKRLGEGIPILAHEIAGQIPRVHLTL